MKNKILLLFLLSMLNNLMFGQEIIELQDTTLVKATNYNHKPVVLFDSTMELKVKAEYFNIKRYILKVSNMFWDTTIINSSEFDSIFCYRYQLSKDKSAKKYLHFISNELNYKCQYEENDSLLLIFNDKINKEKRLEVPVIIKNLNSENLGLRLSTYKYGYSEILKKHIIVWPYQMGVSIFLNDSIVFNRSDKKFLYKLNDDIIINKEDSLVYRFVEYNHQKSIIKLKKNTKPSFIGYRPDFLISSQLISIDKLTVLYFGGHWCYWCKKRLPKLLDIYDKSLNSNFHLKIFSVYQEGYEQQAKDFLSSCHYFKNTCVLFSSNIIKELDITEFPTYIICDKSGKILYRSDFNSDDIVDFLNEML